MQSYSYHIKNNNREEAVLVPESFSFKAMIFGMFWLIYKKCYGEAILFAVFLALITQLLERFTSFPPQGYLIFSSIFHIFLGFEAHDLYRNMLKRKGYIETHTIIGYDILDAEIKILNKEKI